MEKFQLFDDARIIKSLKEKAMLMEGREMVQSMTCSSFLFTLIAFSFLYFKQQLLFLLASVFVAQIRASRHGRTSKAEETKRCIRIKTKGIRRILRFEAALKFKQTQIVFDWT